MAASMARIKEARVRNRVVKWAKAAGLRHVRMALMPGVRAGVPDDLFLIPAYPVGLCVFMEFKRPGRKPTELQIERIEELKSARFLAEWFDDADAAIGYLKALMGAATLHDTGGRPFNGPPLSGAAAPAGRS